MYIFIQLKKLLETRRCDFSNWFLFMFNSINGNIIFVFNMFFKTEKRLTRCFETRGVFLISFGNIRESSCNKTWVYITWECLLVFLFRVFWRFLVAIFEIYEIDGRNYLTPGIFPLLFVGELKLWANASFTHTHTNTNTHRYTIFVQNKYILSI